MYIHVYTQICIYIYIYWCTRHDDVVKALVPYTFVNTCICIYICICVYVNIYIFIYIHVHATMMSSRHCILYICKHMYMYIYIYMCIRVYANMYIFIYTRRDDIVKALVPYTFVNTWMFICICICIYICPWQYISVYICICI